MNPLLKHLTVRLWLTAFLGAAVCLVLLPWWQRFFDLNWLPLPAAMILLITFIIIGWVLNRLGNAFIHRHVKEAAVWERAGMMEEAEKALQHSVAYFDSFWLSPMLRQQRTSWMMATLARFYLSQTVRNPHARTMVADYLCRHPQDDTVAEGWLEQLLNRETHAQKEYEAAARIGEALIDHPRIQQLLMQFHLANDRTDFDAMQNYQNVWQLQQPLPREMEHDLARLLINEGVLSQWALAVYLRAHESGDQGALDGIAAAMRWLHPTIENRRDLARAKALVAEMAPERIDRLAKRFKPEVSDTPNSGRGIKRTSPLVVRAKTQSRAVAASGMAWINTLRTRGQALGRKWKGYKLSRSAAIGGTSAILVVLFFAVGMKTGRDDQTAQPAPIEKTVPIVQPFTIQVAAYVHAADAQRFVDRLKQQGLDAFSTKATSAQRTWYQVKVAHFETKEQARQYGQEMKTKGIIDDFYVANYKGPQPGEP